MLALKSVLSFSLNKIPASIFVVKLQICILSCCYAPLFFVAMFLLLFVVVSEVIRYFKMGSSYSKNLSQDEVDTIAAETGFTPKQIHRLYNRFTSLDKSSNGFLSRQDFLLIPELAINPLGDRIVNEFFKDSQEELNFRDFMRKLARFRKVRPDHSTEFNNREAKLRFLFGMYDLDQDNVISRPELLGMLQMMVGANITPEQMNNIGDRTMAEADLDGDGYISFQEFVNAFDSVDIEQKMSIKFLE